MSSFHIQTPVKINQRQSFINKPRYPFYKQTKYAVLHSYRRLLGYLVVEKLEYLIMYVFLRTCMLFREIACYHCYFQILLAKMQYNFPAKVIEFQTPQPVQSCFGSSLIEIKNLLFCIVQRVALGVTLRILFVG